LVLICFHFVVVWRLCAFHEIWRWNTLGRERLPIHGIWFYSGVILLLGWCLLLRSFWSKDSLCVSNKIHRF
jgi:hypothetical protein